MTAAEAPARGTTFTTKYAIGDIVFRAGTVTELKSHPCPDCLGIRGWVATSPAGREYTFACPRCGSGYQSDRDLSLAYSQHSPHVERLTIGSVRVDSHNTDRPVEYMCIETGVGSGSIHNERDLYPTEEDARKAAETLARVGSTEIDWMVKLYDKTLSLSDYQIGDAALKSARQMKAQRVAEIQMLFDDLRHADTIDDVRETIENFKFRD